MGIGFGSLFTEIYVGKEFFLIKFIVIVVEHEWKKTSYFKVLFSSLVKIEIKIVEKNVENSQVYIHTSMLLRNWAS